MAATTFVAANTMFVLVPVMVVVPLCSEALIVTVPVPEYEILEKVVGPVRV